MSEESQIERMRQRERIALATAAAMFVAGVLLVTVVLPAEYGVDPVGTGSALGLTQIAQGGADPAAPASTAAGSSLEPVRPGANTEQTLRFRRDARTFELGPYEKLEFKYRLERNGSFVYSWRSTGKVQVDFHGEPDGAKKGYAEFYDRSERVAADGAFFAPAPGIHGWYWENLTPDAIKVTLNTAGFFTKGIEFRESGRVEHAIPESE